MLNIQTRKCYDDVEAYVTGTLIIYVVRNLVYRESIPGMKQEYLLLCSVNTGSRTHPGFFLSGVYKGHCRPGVRRLLIISEAAPSLPSTPFLNQVKEYAVTSLYC